MNSALLTNGALNELWMSISRGMMLFGDVEVLKTLIKGAKEIVELGTARGLTSMILASEGAHVTSIDNYENPDFGIGLECLRKDIPKGVNFGKVMGDYLKYFNNIDFIHSNIANAVDCFQNGSIDFLYIDAGHKYKEVKDDYCAFFSKVKIGGIICFHDYSNVHYEVKKFVDDEVIGALGVEEITVETLCRTVIKSFRKIGD